MDQDLNRLELLALISAFLTFVCGLFLFDPVTGDGVRVLATMMVVMLNTTVIVVAFGVLLLPFIAPHLPSWCYCGRVDRRHAIAGSERSGRKHRQVPMRTD